MNWVKAVNKGKVFYEELKEFMDGDYSKESREAFLLLHIRSLSKDGWKGYTSFNDLSVKEMQEILGLENPKPKEISNVDKINQKVRDERAELRNKQVPLIFCKEDETDNLNYEDYTDLIKLAESIGDTAWRNDLLEREMTK